MVESGAFTAVFMTGSGSTMVGVGSDDLPSTLMNWRRDLFIAPARPLMREANGWYHRPPPQLRQTLGLPLGKPKGAALY